MAGMSAADALARVTEHFRAFSAQRNGDAASALHAERVRAMERLTRMGFPSQHDEEWRFTSLAPLLATPFLPASGDDATESLRGATADALATLPFLSDAAAVLVFVDGRFQSAYSHLPVGSTSGAGGTSALTATSIADARRAAQADVDAELLAVQRATGDEQYNAFAELNTAFLIDGAYVRIGEGGAPAAPVHVVHIATSAARPADAAFNAPRLVVRAEPSSELVITETFVTLGGGAHHTNAVAQFLVGENASVRHIRTQIESTAALHTSTITARLERAARFATTSSSIGAHLTRNDVYVHLAGQGGEVTLDGLSLVRGSQHVDNHTVIDHAVPNCASHELYKGVYGDEGRGVFSGRIIVRKDAQKTDARQSNNNLLLSDGASIDTKPQLEILADDVKCTHGATIGRLDEDALFYLRARGISAAEARAILTTAFAGEVIERVGSEPMRTWLDTLMHERLLADVD